MKNTGKNIKKLRLKNRWNQAQVAKKLGISVPAFSKIETSATDVNISRLRQIATLFEVSIQELIAEEGEEDPQLKNTGEIMVLNNQLQEMEKEIILLQKKLIDLYEEVMK
ncbi:MAG TPA: helix-turn-helix transcriptional regulator [Pedobacter sp.]